MDTVQGGCMSTDSVPRDTVWGGPAPEPRPWGVRATLTAFGIAAVIAGLGGGAIYAATGHASSSQFTGPPGQHGPGPGAPGGPGGHAGHDGAPLHGQVVVADGAGGYVTVSSQTGVVTATTPGSVTVRSKDGFTQTWAVSADQGSAYAVDDTVMIRGEQTGNEPTPKVTEVLDPLITPS